MSRHFTNPSSSYTGIIQIPGTCANNKQHMYRSQRLHNTSSGLCGWYCAGRNFSISCTQEQSIIQPPPFLCLLQVIAAKFLSFLFPHPSVFMLLRQSRSVSSLPVHSNPLIPSWLLLTFLLPVLAEGVSGDGMR